MSERLSKAELESELEEAREAFLKEWCPEINAKCRDDCKCYYTGKVYTTKYENGKEVLNVLGPSCSHVLVSREITRYEP